VTEPAEAADGGALERRLRQAQRRRDEAHRQRHRHALELLPEMHVGSGERRWVDFSGNDYLGLAREPAVTRRLAEAAREYGSGAGASALVSGYHPEHQALERELAEFLQRDAVLLCSSGWHANLAAITSLAGRGDFLVQDRLCHASLVDAARLSGARLLRYPHADPAAMRRQLLRCGTDHRLLVSDGVFSMDGDLAPVEEMAQLAREFDATLVLDDAHGIGVLGPEGRGATAGLDQARLPVLVGTLGKALGGIGAFVAGSRALVRHLVNEGRSYVYTTALPPAQAAATRRALALLRRESWRRERLRGHIERFREGAARRGIPLLPSATAIQPLLAGSEKATLDLARRLAGSGYRVGAIRPPTVPAGTSRLRITLSAAHEHGQIDGLLDALEDSLGAFPIGSAQ
jgi:8-amino-7-oxononanoate synthase